MAASVAETDIPGIEVHTARTRGWKPLADHHDLNHAAVLVCQSDRLIRGPLYPELQDHKEVLSYLHVKGMARDLFFWDHNHKEGGTDQGKSRFNDYEVQACLGLAR